MKIETERLIIKDFTIDMAKDVSINSLDEDTKRFIPDEVFETVEDAIETINFLIAVYGDYTSPQIHPIFTKEDNKNIGYVELVPLDDDIFEIGYHIAKKYTGKGYAIEAVKAFLPVITKKAKINEVLGICVKENIASIKVLEKCGFKVIYQGLGKYQGEEREIFKSVWTNK